MFLSCNVNVSDSPEGGALLWLTVSTLLLGSGFSLGGNL